MRKIETITQGRDFTRDVTPTYAILHIPTGGFLLEAKGYWVEKGKGYTSIDPQKDSNLRIRTFVSLQGAKQALRAYCQGKWEQRISKTGSNWATLSYEYTIFTPNPDTARDIKEFKIVELERIEKCVIYKEVWNGI